MARKRNIRKSVYFTAEEYAIAVEKMKKIKMSDFGAFVRKILEVGIVLNLDTKGLRELSYEVHKIGVNVNQIAKKANQSGNIYKNDLEKINEQLNKIAEYTEKIYSKFNEFSEG